LSELLRGTLRVILPVTMARSSVGPNLVGFLRTYPELRIEITLRGGRLDPIAERVGCGLSKQPPPLRSPQDLTKHSCVTMTTARGGKTWNLYKDGKAQEVRLRGRVSV
jgi:DNA-binding transcriptional LysR family regulator